MSPRICLVEDDPTIREIVADRLRDRGYDVVAHSEADTLLAQKRLTADLYIVDRLLPGEASGGDLCAHLRTLSPTVPVLILSALSEPSDRVEGLRLGADDYLTKPFEMEELALRVEGMLKRRSWYAELPAQLSRFEWDGNAVDFERFVGRTPGGTVVMTQKECMLMKLLVEREGHVVSRDEILDRVWGYDAFPSNRTVDNFIVRLRRYFEPEPGVPKYIHSVRGLGYKFTTRPPA